VELQAKATTVSNIISVGLKSNKKRVSCLWLLLYYTAIPYRVIQGENRVFPVKFSHTGKNLFSLHGIPAMKTSFSL
jgi:hypothetical protein